MIVSLCELYGFRKHLLLEITIGDEVLHALNLVSRCEMPVHIDDIWQCIVDWYVPPVKVTAVHDQHEEIDVIATRHQKVILTLSRVIFIK